MRPRTLPLFVPLTLAAALACDPGNEPGGTATPAGSAPAPSDAQAKPREKSSGAAPGEKPTEKPAEKPTGDAGATPAAKPAEQPPAPDGAGASGGKRELAKNTFEPPTKEELAKATVDAKTHLAAGRKAVKAGDFAAGIAELEKAKAISPTNATVLGELGWARFKAGDHDAAARDLKLALTHVDKAKTRGAVLYNLGRVEEARGRKEVAADLYRQSLAVRPNATVESRLTGLGGPATVTHAECELGPKRAATKDLCAAWAKTLNESDEGAQWRCEYDPNDATGRTMGGASFPVTIAPDVTATVFSVWDPELNMAEVFYVAIVIGDDVWVDELATVQHPGVGYADENVNDVKITARELAGGGLPEVLVEWSWGGHDMDPGIEHMEDYGTQAQAVLSVDGGAPRWLATFTTTQERSWGAMDTKEWGGMVDPESTGHAHDVSFDGKGGVTVARTEGDDAEGMKVGTYPLAEAPLRCPSEIAYY